MIYMLFDNPADKQNMMFLNDYKTAKIQQIYPQHKLNSTKEMLIACTDTIKRTNDGDTIICWYDFMAVLCWWICKLQFKKRKIIAFNILLKDKATKKNKLAKLLYKSMLKSNDVKATVTSQKYGEHLNKMLGINKQFTLLHDIYHDNYNIDYQGNIIPNSVFCGGRNGRDWDFLIKIANVMPEVVFNCVMPKDVYEQYKDSFSKNMIVKNDIPEMEFLKLMCSSQLVVTPLDTEAPAGLIAFYQAAANSKMIITSDTVTTQEYMSDDKGVLCGRNIDDWKKQILFYLKNIEETNSRACKLKRFLECECSEIKYANTILELITE